MTRVLAGLARARLMRVFASTFYAWLVGFGLAAWPNTGAWMIDGDLWVMNYTDVMNTLGRAYILAILEQESDPHGFARRLGDAYGLDATTTDDLVREFSRELSRQALE